MRTTVTATFENNIAQATLPIPVGQQWWIDEIIVQTMNLGPPNVNMTWPYVFAAVSLNTPDQLIASTSSGTFDVAEGAPVFVQAGDTLCPRFVLNQEGPDMTNTPNASACWKK